MMIGVLTLGALGIAGAAVYALLPGNELKDATTFFVCYGMGAAGAVVSVMTRMSQTTGTGFIDYEVGRPALRRVGSFRPMIGAVFAVVLYFALQSGLINVATKPPSGTTTDTTTFFYASLAFIAGFSERRARILLGGATKMLGDVEEDPAAHKTQPDPDKPAEGSSA